ncbi:bifunctional folylpolyglutamate synthase/dihydrofolate synthase [Parapedobacter sp. ISTM3]|uniref:bifunctional folylpolyglutamate synthase/dihydrofolate synthase n=1 Tax=Parapedobacter sp. ISTM3 TaxID=2800130 RepID=UPI001905F9ED|nr:folylpolyglutamate synthase/dihydrofolate synthase family protein [Parapedobacter sp. ISTM3]MBK1439070.1 bifunctional folylpolyglutamate synthase/dihydrofolate synthase [Parapedobacter sp. ISTM3]
MQYEEAVDYLYARLPMFTRDGASALKKDLTNTYRLCEALGNPQERFKAVHIAGTNGKGSTSHMLAAILQAAGYKTGLYTSPHLLDFRERIRINGVMIAKQAVVDFVGEYQPLIAAVEPSFFEVTVAMAFKCFADEQVDIAIVETGLGGRLDSTNIITPLLSIITNIGYDHIQLLGNTLQEIASEKAGIIKPGVPVIIGEWQMEVAGVFERAAAVHASRLMYASQLWQVTSMNKHSGFLHVNVNHRSARNEAVYALDLTGSYQTKNLATVLCAVDELRRMGFSITDTHVGQALMQVQHLTGLMGRWQTLSVDPLVICDTGHNADGWREVLANISATPHHALHMVIGVMRDKDLNNMLPMLPREARYYFCQVAMPRALPAQELHAAAINYGLEGSAFTSVREALQAARQHAGADDLIFVGGSTFVVGELLAIY